MNLPDISGLSLPELIELLRIIADEIMLREMQNAGNERGV